MAESMWGPWLGIMCAHFDLRDAARRYQDEATAFARGLNGGIFTRTEELVVSGLRTREGW